MLGKTVHVSPSTCVSSLGRFDTPTWHVVSSGHIHSGRFSKPVKHLHTSLCFFGELVCLLFSRQVIRVSPVDRVDQGDTYRSFPLNEFNWNLRPPHCDHRRVAEQGITFNISLPMNVSQTPGGHFTCAL